MDSSTTLNQTPLHATHVSLGARMMAFGGFDMPVQYTSIIDEHMAVRERAGLFDVSHMGEVFVRGPKAFDCVQYLVTNDAAKLYDGRAMYCCMCQPDGGIVDDLLVYRLDEHEYMLVINAANIEKDVAWVQAHNPMEADLEDASDGIALLALQGPRAFETARSITDADPGRIPYYHAQRLPPGTFFDCQFALFSHTGYTGEPGLEIYCDAGQAVAVWEALMNAGAPHGLLPAGLGARDTLRLEAGYCLYGNDITEDTNPLEAGLGWITKLDKGDFIGRDALVQAREAGLPRKLVGFVVEERGIPRHGYKIQDATGTPIGTVTSGTQSPVLQQGIGLGYVPNQPAYTEPGSALHIATRRGTMAASVHRPPFHKK